MKWLTNKQIDRLLDDFIEIFKMSDGVIIEMRLLCEQAKLVNATQRQPRVTLCACCGSTKVDGRCTDCMSGW